MGNGRSELKATAEQVKQKTGEVAQQVGQEAKSLVSTRKGEAATLLRSVADAFRQTSMDLESNDQGTVAQYGNQLAAQVERLSNYLENNDTDRLIMDVESWARRRPELFLGGAFAAGLLIGRFLRSSSPPSHSSTPRPRRYLATVSDEMDAGPYSYGELQGESGGRATGGSRLGESL
jgi:hypothetical protein